MSIRVTEELLKGNYGEHLAAQVLSRFCLVRPVVGNTDIGVDLYCESIIKGTPFLHFWVQVKSKKSFANKPGAVPCSFQTKNLKYWARQPVPVIALLVPMRWPPDKIHCIHVIDITLDTLIAGIRADKNKQSLRARPDLALPIQDVGQLDSQLEKVLVHQIPMTVSAMYSEKGFLFPAPKPEEEYTKYYSAHILNRCIPKIEENIKHAATFGIIQYIDSGGDISVFPKSLISVLKTLEDQTHYEVFESRGVLNQAKGDYSKAKSNYKKAIERIQRDPNIDSTLPPWSECVMRLNKRIESLPKGT